MSGYDYYDVEIVTNARCAECNDKLAEWEDTLCCICEAMAE
jgi:hypothetical protein